MALQSSSIYTIRQYSGTGIITKNNRPLNKFLFISVLVFALGINVFAGGPTICTMTSNNDCVDAISLTIDVACADGCTQGATIEVGEVGDCMSGNQSIWYNFIATSTSHQVNVWLDNSGGCFNASAVWDGSGGCLPGPADILSCHDAANGPLNQAHLLTTLTIGNTYYIQVAYGSGGPCGAGTDVCVEVITYDPCDICGDECYAACEFATIPAVPDVTCCCPSNVYDPPMHERFRKECYTFMANSASTTFSAAVLSDCSGGQFTQLFWELYDAGCTLIDGPTNIFIDNSAATTAGNSYTVCYDMVFAECNISELWIYVVVGGVLPIELLYFDVDATDENSVHIVWSTASETNNDYFTIERSLNGKIFDPIIVVLGAGMSNSIIEYSTVDDSPYFGTSYYRLKQTDYDGMFEYSNLVTVKIDSFSRDIFYFDIFGRKFFKKWEYLSPGIYIRTDGTNYDRIVKER